jgi:hypothetical protein
MFNTQITFICVWMELQVSNLFVSFCAIFVYGGVIVCLITTMVPNVEMNGGITTISFSYT